MAFGQLVVAQHPLRLAIDHAQRAAQLVGHAGCQPPHCRQLLALTQARLQLLLAGLLLGDLAFGGGDAVEHLVQRAGQHHDLLRPAARCTVLAVSRRDPLHAARQLLQVLAHGRTVAKQDHHQRHAGQQPAQPGSDQPQATDVAFEVPQRRVTCSRPLICPPLSSSGTK